jgi:catechol 2,3-dioxygenase-like lactoylglutathione lyase family enzyme
MSRAEIDRGRRPRTNCPHDSPEPIMIMEATRMSPVNHVEMTVSDLERSTAFYAALFRDLGWKTLRPTMFILDGCEVYLKEDKAAAPATAAPRCGPRHVCFRAASREVVDRVAETVRSLGGAVIRGPQAMPQYSPTYYTVDFRDPDGFVLEVAHD